MSRLLALLSGLALALSVMPAGAHSISSKGELDRLMGGKEKYFQALDRQAPEFTLQDADGNGVSRDDLIGKVVVLHFIYAGCPDVCPLHADRIAEIQKMVNGTPMKEAVQFIAITTDPENDTPDVLRDYGPAHGLDPVNWVFLTTTPEQPEDATRRLAEAHGHTFTKGDGGYQVHSVVTHIFDTQGRWRANFHGLKFEPSNLVVFINALVNETSAPPGHGHVEPSWWDKLRSLF